MSPYLWTSAGFLLLFIGAEALVRGSSALALRLHVRPLVVGLTVVAFGTSMPEMTVSVQAALEGDSGIALGNVIGSNICNLGLILGISALIRPLAVHSQTVRLDIPVMIGASILSALFIINGIVSRFEGFLLLIGMTAYLFYTLNLARNDKIRIPVSAPGDPEIKYASWILIVIQVVVGLAGLIQGSHWLVNGAVALALRWHMPQSVIGLTLVAVGTSLPELATSVTAAWRKQPDLAVGNIVGSNIFNTLAILGTAAIVDPLESTALLKPSLAALLVFSLVSLPLVKSGFRLNRLEGGILFGLYILYNVVVLH